MHSDTNKVRGFAMQCHWQLLAVLSFLGFINSAKPYSCVIKFKVTKSHLIFPLYNSYCRTRSMSTKHGETTLISFNDCTPCTLVILLSTFISILASFCPGLPLLAHCRMNRNSYSLHNVNKQHATTTAALSTPCQPLARLLPLQVVIHCYEHIKMNKLDQIGTS